jgi:Predicted membrane protein (DUF2339)
MEFTLIVLVAIYCAFLTKQIGLLQNTIRSLTKQLDALGKDFEVLKKQGVVIQNTANPVQTPVSQPTPAVQPQPSLSEASTVSTIHTSPQQQGTNKPQDHDETIENSFSFVEWIRKDFLVKIGGFFVILALAWFVSFAFANDWIGPSGRVSLGIIFGGLMMLVGYWQLDKNPAPARVITLVGTTTIITTLFSARIVFDLLTPEIAFFGMVLTIAFTVLIAVLRNSRSIGILALTGSYLVPGLVGSRNPDLNGLFWYIVMVNIASLALMYFRGWRVLQLTSMVATIGFSSLFYSDTSINKWLFIGIFVLLFQSSAIYAVLRTKKLVTLDIINSIVSTIISVTWIVSFVDSQWRVLTLVGLSICTFLIAVVFDINKATRSYTYVQLIASLSTLAFATFLQYGDNSTAFIFAFTIELVASQWLMYKLFDDIKPFYLLPFFHIIPVSYFLTLSFDAGRDFTQSMLLGTGQSSDHLIRNIYVNVFIIAAFYVNAMLIGFVKQKVASLMEVSTTLKIMSAAFGYLLLVHIHAYLAHILQLNTTMVLNISIPFFLAIAAIFALFFALYEPAVETKAYRYFGFFSLYTITVVELLQVTLTDNVERILIWFVFTTISLSLLALPKSNTDRLFMVFGHILLAGSLGLQLPSNITQIADLYRISIYVICLIFALFIRYYDGYRNQQITRVIGDITLAVVLIMLLVVELWSLGIVVRIITFVGVGALLIFTGFIKKKNT